MEQVVPLMNAALNLWMLSKLYELTAKINRFPCEKDAKNCEHTQGKDAQNAA